MRFPSGLVFEVITNLAAESEGLTLDSMGDALISHKLPRTRRRNPSISQRKDRHIAFTSRLEGVSKADTEASEESVRSTKAHLCTSMFNGTCQVETPYRRTPLRQKDGTCT